jgi:glutathione S-transferase
MTFRPSRRCYAAQLSSGVRQLNSGADTRLGEVLIWQFYNEVVIRRFGWRERPDEQVPSVLECLERQLPPAGLLLKSVSISDISFVSLVRNTRFAKYEIDKQRWPQTAGYMERVFGLPAFQQQVPFEQLSLRTPSQQHRSALIEAGAPTSAQTLGTSTPCRGVLSI